MPYKPIRMFATYSLADAKNQVFYRTSNRFRNNNKSKVENGIISFPVALFFIRGSQNNLEDENLKEIIRNFGYWDKDSGKFLDIVLFGWGKDGEMIHYDETAFIACKDQLESISKWRYSGGTDLLILDFEIPIIDGEISDKGNFSFECAIPLFVDEMISNKRTESLENLMQLLINKAKDLHEEKGEFGRYSIIKLSDKIIHKKGVKGLWGVIRKLFLKDFDEVYKELRPYKICDLRV